MLASQHATIRMQQRGIPAQVVRHIIDHGSTRKVPGGAIARFMSKKDLQRLPLMLPRNDCLQLDRHKRVYVVMDDNCIITVGHRTKRFNR